MDHYVDYFHDSPLNVPTSIGFGPSEQNSISAFYMDNYSSPRAQPAIDILTDVSSLLVADFPSEMPSFPILGGLSSKEIKQSRSPKKRPKQSKKTQLTLHPFTSDDAPDYAVAKLRELLGLKKRL